MNRFAIKDALLQSDMDCSGKDVLDANLVAATTVMIGAKARLVAMSNGVKIEVFDGVNWIEQVSYTE